MQKFIMTKEILESIIQLLGPFPNKKVLGIIDILRSLPELEHSSEQ